MIESNDEISIAEITRRANESGLVNISKPTIGVYPEKLWKEDRCKELARAIHERVEAGDFQTAEKWVVELSTLFPEVVRRRGGL